MLFSEQKLSRIEVMAMNYTKDDHTFVIMAYQVCPYLEECISSIMNQTVLGHVIMSTSTPNEYIVGLAEKYNLPLAVNKGRGDGWGNNCFAYDQAKTKLVTLCHQDDYYRPQYLERALKQANRGGQMIILYTDYFEDRGGTEVHTNKLLRVKRLMNFPLRFRPLQSCKWLRRLILSLGNPVCQPAVTYNKTVIPALYKFSDESSTVGDWLLWISAAKLSGDFIYCPEQLMAHRIWEGSGTTETIDDGTRSRDEHKIFSLMWPAFIAKCLTRLYSSAQKSNQNA